MWASDQKRQLLYRTITYSSLEDRVPIGKGSFGEVARAWWRDGDIDVAVKCSGASCADPAALDNERRGLGLVLRRPHRNIVTMYGECTDAPDGKVLLVMELCKESVYRCLQRRREELEKVCHSRHRAW